MHDRRRTVGGATLLLVGVLVATIGCGENRTATGSPDPETSPGESVIVDPTPANGTTTVECGRPFQLPPAGRLTLTGRFPTSVAAGERTVAGTVEVTSQVALRGVAHPSADVFLVRDGRVVTVPAVQDSIGVRLDLEPGKAERLPGAATLMSCDPSGTRVSPGAYQLYAHVLLTLDDTTIVESFGGPWPLEVR